MELTLYTARGSRGLVCEWLLEEIGLPYTRVEVDLAARAHKSAEHLRVHPLGAVPALLVDGQPIIETLAIRLFLAERDARGRLARPPVTGAARARWLQWMVYPAVTLEPALVPAFSRGLAIPEADRPGVATSDERARFAELLVPLEGCMSRGAIAEVGFGAADVGLCCRLLPFLLRAPFAPLLPSSSSSSSYR